MVERSSRSLCCSICLLHLTLWNATRANVNSPPPFTVTKYVDEALLKTDFTAPSDMLNPLSMFVNWPGLLKAFLCLFSVLSWVQGSGCLCTQCTVYRIVLVHYAEDRIVLVHCPFVHDCTCTLHMCISLYLYTLNMCSCTLPSCTGCMDFTEWGILPIFLHI